MLGAVANGENGGVAGLQVVVDDNPVAGVEACLVRELGVRHDADADDDEIGRVRRCRSKARPCARVSRR